MGPPGDLSSSDDLRRVSHLIALQGIFGIILLFTRYLPDRSLVIAVRGGDTLTLLDAGSLAVFALFLILTGAILRYGPEKTLREKDPFLPLGVGNGIPSVTLLLFRLVHALFSVIIIGVYLTSPPGSFPSLNQEAGVFILILVLVFSSSRVSSGITSRSRRLGRWWTGNRRRHEILSYLIFLGALGLILTGIFSGSQFLLIGGWVLLSIQILYVIFLEDRKMRAG